MNGMNQFVFWMCPIRKSLGELAETGVGLDYSAVQPTQHKKEEAIWIQPHRHPLPGFALFRAKSFDTFDRCIEPYRE